MDTDKQFMTKTDLQLAFNDFEQKIREQHETRIQMISGHYSDVLKSNQELSTRVCSLDNKIDVLICQIQPILEAQKVVVLIHKFFKWLGIPVTAIGVFIYWVMKNI